MGRELGLRITGLISLLGKTFHFRFKIFRIRKKRKKIKRTSVRPVPGLETLHLLPEIYGPASFPRLRLPHTSDLLVQLPFQQVGTWLAPQASGGARWQSTRGPLPPSSPGRVAPAGCDGFPQRPLLALPPTAAGICQNFICFALQPTSPRDIFWWGWQKEKPK